MKTFFHSSHRTFLFLATSLLFTESDARDVEGEVQYNKDSCWDIGYIDYVGSAGLCQLSCTITEGCNSFGFRHDWLGRCHLCSWTYPRTDTSCSSTTEPCHTWGLRLEGGVDAASILNDGIEQSTKICSGSLRNKDALELAQDLNVIVKKYGDGGFDSVSSFMSNLPSAAAQAAAVLLGETKKCRRKFTGPTRSCRYGGLVFHQLRAFLIYVDGGSASRAFPAGFDNYRKALLQNHQIFLADNGWMNNLTLQKINKFYSQLPLHMKTEGILYEAMFATQTVRDAWLCNGNFAGSLGTSKRGFNVFQTQVGDSREQAFPNDTPNIPPSFDLQMTVTRHEVAHQFDRIIYNRADSRLKDMKTMLTAASQGNDDSWLRSNVGDSYFQGAPQEIIASQVGNQYLASSSSQLRLAATRLTKSDNWTPPTYQTVTEGVPTLTRENKSCASTSKQLGTVYTAQECVDRAMNDSSCSYEIMYSTEYSYSWGCYCCQPFDALSCPSEDALYNDHSLWDVYQYKNTDATPECDGTGLPLSWFLFNVEILTPVGSSITTFFENEVDGEVITVEALITRDGDNNNGIASIDLPFCDKIDFGYDTATGIVNSVSEHASSCTFSCQDDENWSLTTNTGKKYFCSWVAYKPRKRCKRVGDDGRRARSVCLQACNMC
mmetsp:Transcript_10099/g.15127  ORF Transcript_10099/g.15127 Transcript_10099/m.15127 type:complete len:661 (-) Transcript_10099:292-2274(-)